MVEDLSGEWVGRAICSVVCNFALVRIFGISQTISLVSIPKILTNTKATPPLLRLFFCESWDSSVNLKLE